MSVKKWSLLSYDTKLSSGLSEQISSAADMSKLCAEILIARGVNSAAQAIEMTQNSPLEDPFVIADMYKAVQRIKQAVDEGERICVYGDYDCDGITSTVVVYSYLETMGADVMYYLPDRHEEGYGLNNGAVDSIAEAGATLIITVDNGISAHGEIEYASQLGIEVIVTDHHQPRETLPNAYAVINPHRADCQSTFKELAGVGVAFKLVCALEGDITCEDMLEQYGDIVALGTVADVVSLTGENRTIVTRGLEIMQNTSNAGLRALIEISSLSSKKLTSQIIAFGLAPRINAVSRLGDADEAIKLLLCEDEDYALELAGNIQTYNNMRKEKEQQIVAEIAKQIEENPSLVQNRVIILTGENWHHGVIGIVCSKIVERFLKPCIIISVNDGEARASARSVEGFSIIKAIESASSCLTKYGGHNQAAGFSLLPEKIEKFSKRIQLYAMMNFKSMPIHTVKIDRMVTPDMLTVQNVQSIDKLEPFGAQNDAPVFVMRKSVIEQITPLSEGKHVRLTLNKNGVKFQALYFGMALQNFPYRTGEMIDFVFSCDVSEYMGEKKVSVKIKDIHLFDFKQNDMFLSKQLYERYECGEILSTDETAECMPSRDDAAAVYRYIKNTPVQFDYDIMAQYLQREKVEYAKMMIILNALSESGLIEINKNNSNGNLQITSLKNVQKTDLFSAPSIMKLADMGKSI